jgi:hypothetical protein
MAPINFEDDFRAKLDKRSIAPSKNAWNKLSERLDNQEESSNKKPYWWLGVAASVIGVLLIVSQIFNDDKIDEPVIVDTPEEIIKTETTTIAIDNNEALEENEKPILQVENKEIQKEVIKQKRLIVNKKKNGAVALTLEKELIPDEVKFKTETDLLSKELTFEEKKVQDIVAQVQRLKEENNEVTDADIEALLVAAQKEIQLNRLYNETTGVVDANALLQDVEAELDQSFRTKVFDALKSSFNSVKTAVAQRNN